LDPWPTIRAACLELLRQSGVDADAAARELSRWYAQLTVTAGGLVSVESLEVESYLTLDEKARLVYAAISEFASAGVFPDAPRAESKPHTALALGCMQFPDHGPDISDTAGELARFQAFNHARRMLSRAGLPGLYSSPSGSSARDLLANPLNFRNPRLLRTLEGRLRGGMDVNIFATTAEWIDSQGDSGDALAERVRDGLGLPHLDGQEVVEIRIPENVVRHSGTFKKPTFADAQGWPPFLPSRADDAFGYARYLAALPQRGGPEIWHGPLLARQASGIRLLGRAATAMADGFWSQYGRWT
jgi:hypothetical protein